MVVLVDFEAGKARVLAVLDMADVRKLLSDPKREALKGKKKVLYWKDVRREGLAR